MVKTFMRVDKELLEKLKAKKLVARESYADVVRRMIDKEVYGNNTNDFGKFHDQQKKSKGFIGNVKLEKCSFCGKLKRQGMPCSCTYGGVFG